MSALTAAADDEVSAMIAELEQENRLLRARNERLQATLDKIVPRLEAACGASAMPPRIARELIEQNDAPTIPSEQLAAAQRLIDQDVAKHFGGAA